LTCIELAGNRPAGRRETSTQASLPLSGGKLESPLNFAATATDGSPAIPLDAHVRLASAELNGGVQILGERADLAVYPMLATEWRAANPA
jgi:hypothetical protein